jgi:hypothetical protein
VAAVVPVQIVVVEVLVDLEKVKTHLFLHTQFRL